MNWQGSRRPDNELRVIDDARGNSLGFTVAAGNVRDSQKSRSLIQFLKEIHLFQAGKLDVEERG